MNRIYYSGFYIASALAVLDGFSTSKHRQLIGYFNKQYISTGIIDYKSGSILKLSFDKRKVTDYGDFVVITKTQIEEHQRNMIQFIDAVKILIDQKIDSLCP